MATINHIIGLLVSPIAAGLALIGLSLLSALLLKKRRYTVSFSFLALMWFWLWSTPLMTMMLGIPLEKEFAQTRNPENLPQADAIIVLGGGMNVATNDVLLADMSASADRIWHGARLYKAGKAPKIIATGYNVEAANGELFADFGVPRESLICLEGPRNTEEEARAVDKLFDDGEEHTIILVTSAWHMRRALLMFSKTRLKVVPSAADLESTVRLSNGFDAGCLCPVGEVLGFNTSYFKEHYAYFGYKTLRGY